MRHSAIAVELYLSPVDVSRVLWGPSDQADARPLPQASFQVLRTEIWQRMASAGAPTDRLDHQLLFIRSGLSWSVADADADGEPFRRQSHGEEDPQEIPDATPLLKEPDGIKCPVDAQYLNTAMVGATLALAQPSWPSPIKFALSLTETFESAIDLQAASSCSWPPSDLHLLHGPHRCF